MRDLLAGVKRYSAPPSPTHILFCVSVNMMTLTLDLWPDEWNHAALPVSSWCYWAGMLTGGGGVIRFYRNFAVTVLRRWPRCAGNIVDVHVHREAGELERTEIAHPFLLRRYFFSR